MHKRIISFFVLTAIFVSAFSLCSFAKNNQQYNNIFDDARLFQNNDFNRISEKLKEFEGYGVAEVYTNNSSNVPAKDQAKNALNGRHGFVFLIDVNNREIYIYSTLSKLTPSKCRSITANTYKRATNGEYTDCVIDSLNQIKLVLDGEGVPEPMKNMSNAFLSLVISIWIIFGAAAPSFSKNKINTRRLITQVNDRLEIVDQNKVLTNQYVIREKSSSGRHSGGGGRHSSGGGGGHGF